MEEWKGLPLTLRGWASWWSGGSILGVCTPHGLGMAAEDELGGVLPPLVVLLLVLLLLVLLLLLLLVSPAWY